MTSWKEFEQQAIELAAFGKTRFASGVAYLGTVRPNGSPRVHPVTPIIGEQLFLFMEPTSPKGKELRLDDRYVLHCSVENSEGGGGEFYVRGHAVQSDDPELRAQALRMASYTPADRYILFVLSVDFAFMNTYGDSGSQTRWWKSETR